MTCLNIHFSYSSIPCISVLRCKVVHISDSTNKNTQVVSLKPHDTLHTCLHSTFLTFNPQVKSLLIELKSLSKT